MRLSLHLFMCFNLITIWNLFAAIQDTLWTKSYDHHGWEFFRSATQTSDSGFICLGQTYAFEGPDDRHDDLWMVKVNKDGDTLWTRTLDTNSTSETPGDVIEMKGFNNDLLFIGGIEGEGNKGYPDCHVVRTDKFGNIRWEKRYDFQGTSNKGNRVVQTIDNTFMICGYTYNYLSLDKDILLQLINAKGDTIWTKSYDLGYNVWEGAYSIIQISDGGYVLTGAISFKFNSPWDDLFIMKVDKDGNFLWSKIYGGPGFDDGECIKQTKEGGFIIAGKYVQADDGQLWLLKTDMNGDTLWTRTYGGVKGEWGSSIELTDDGGYIVCGTTETFGKGFWDIWVVRVDSLGNVQWTKTFGDLSGDTGSSIQKTSEGGYIVSGMTSSLGIGGTSRDGYLIRLAPEDISTMDEDYNKISTTFTLSQNYPNPFNPSTQIQYALPSISNVIVTVYNSLGQTVKVFNEGTKEAGNHNITFNGEGLSSGI